jgi:aspartyl-tRNA synthetase
MSFLKKPFQKLKEINNVNSSNNTSTDSAPSKTEGISSSPLNGAILNGKIPNGLVSNGTASNGSATPNDTLSIATALSSVKAKANGSGTSTPQRSDSRRQSREILDLEKKRRSIDKERAKAETRKRESLARIEDERFLQEGPPALTKLYRPYSMNMSKRWNTDDRILFKNVNWEGMPTALQQLRLNTD